MKIKSFRQAKLANKKVLVRVDYNVPMKNGEVVDDMRIRETIPTINYLLSQNCKIILISHLGRPEGKIVESLRLDPIAARLSKLLDKPVIKLDDCIGPGVDESIKNLPNGLICLLENVRFHPEEEACTDEFSKKLAKLGDVFVLDAFATVHRAHASTYGIGRYIPAYAGLLMEKEIEALSPIVEALLKKPVILIMGGAKIDTKIGIIKNFIGKAQYFLIGGGLANTFLEAEGYNIAKSLSESNKISVAQETMLAIESFHESFILPKDVIISDLPDSQDVLNVPIDDLEGESHIYDIGLQTTKKYCEIISQAATIIWNGPMGLYENKLFRAGTSAVADAIASNKKAISIIGGGDTVDAITQAGHSFADFTHVSTGGGAMLEFLEGKELPGISLIRA